MRVVGSVTKSESMRDRTCAPYARMLLAVALPGLNGTIYGNYVRDYRGLWTRDWAHECLSLVT